MGRAAPGADLGAATDTEKVLCDAACLARVDGLPETVTPSGLKFKDIAVGKGPTPPTGYQARSLSPGGPRVAGSSLALRAALKDRQAPWLDSGENTCMPLQEEGLH